ncbi:hypothetical protein J2S49_000585 [Arcanobacterium wilhelmae]|uniref:DUF2568 domain-containing protein n=1 Tax=Arcanobacterium wilhelmae TaxID=1803177 RepID=A0ABT9N9X3_9ACTO|nr:hypothetical protein [Arcanobacterium wilhelmae]MDP9800509.1 hypothetical protein [Arcanobacterium wilhelmae]WFN89927.1 hypothetical protein P8A24_06945 [Arcanobacterium wilhelmae]
MADTGGLARRPHAVESFESRVLSVRLALSVFAAAVGGVISIFFSPDAGAQVALGGAFFALAEFASRGVWGLAGPASTAGALGAYASRIVALGVLWLATAPAAWGAVVFALILIASLISDVVILTSRPAPFVH